MVLNALSHLQPLEHEAGPAVGPSHRTDPANCRASITTIRIREIVLSRLPHLRPCESGAVLAVRPNRWTDSITSIRENFFALTLASPAVRMWSGAGSSTPSSAGNGVKLFPVRSFERMAGPDWADSATRMASIISIRFRPRECSRAGQFDPNIGRISATRMASIISISWKWS